MVRGAIVIAVAALQLAACTTERQTSPTRTATEQMLISTAADRAAADLALGLTPGTRIYVDASNFEGTDSRYAVAAIRDRLLRDGAALVRLPSDAEVIVEIRAGALSIDESDTLFGIPSYQVPVPLTSGPLELPEVALYKQSERKGVVKIAAVAYHAESGRLIAASDPRFGYSHERDYRILFFSWSTSDLPQEEGDGLLPEW